MPGDILRACQTMFLLFDGNFGVGSDVQTGPNGNLYVVSLERVVIYEGFRR